MTELTILQKELSKFFKTHKQVSPARDQMAFFTTLKVDVEEGSLTLTSINNDVYFKSKVKTESTNNTKTSFCVKADNFISAVNSISSDDTILLQLKDTQIVIKGSRVSHKINKEDAYLSDFENQKEPEKSLVPTFRGARETVNKYIKNALAAVGTPQNVYDPQFLSICFMFLEDRQEMHIVSTDRYRVSTNILISPVTLDTFDLDGIKKYLLRAKPLEALLGLHDESGVVSFDFTEEGLLVESENKDYTLLLKYSGTHENKYPDYRKIIPSGFKCQFNVNKQELLNSIKQVYLIAKNNIANKAITAKVSPSKSLIELSASNEKNERAEVKLDIECYTGDTEDWEQSFNAEYIMSYLNSTSAEVIVWKANPGKPSVLANMDRENEEYYLISGLK
jgi:DNA polymerase-3 subunit beta